MNFICYLKIFNIFNIKALYFDKDGKIYLDNDTATVVNGFTLNKNDWLDVTVVAVKNKTNAGIFAPITGETSASLGSMT